MNKRFIKNNKRGNSLMAVLIIVLVLSLIGSSLMLTSRKNEDIITESRKKEEIKYELKMELLKLINYIRLDYAYGAPGTPGADGCPPFFYGVDGCTPRERESIQYDQTLNQPQAIYCRDISVTGCAQMPFTTGNTQYFVNPDSLGDNNTPTLIPNISLRAQNVNFPSNYFDDTKYGYFVFRPKIHPPLSDGNSWLTTENPRVVPSPGGPGNVAPTDRSTNPPVLAIHLMVVDTHLGSKSMNTIDAIVSFDLYPVTEGTEISNNRITSPRVRAVCGVNSGCASPWTALCTGLPAGETCPEVLARTGEIKDLKYRTMRYDY